MKIIAFILSVYIILLIAMPCVDVPNDHNSLKLELSNLKTDNHHSDSNLCTPFCTCDCCITPVIQQDSSIRLDCLDYTYRKYSEFSVSYTFSLFAYIWQPPKLS